MPPCQISPEIFRAYDIRGICGKGLTREIVFLLGRAIASEALDQGIFALVVGRDARLSSPEYHRALVDGILASGCDVTDIGVVPTPVLYFATHSLTIGSGIMITGSHNPAEYNGLKIVFHRQSLADTQIERFRERIEKHLFSEGQGKLNTVDIIPEYIARVCHDIKPGSAFRVVIDAGNGVAGTVAPDLFRSLGCEVMPLYCNPDGHFPNHHPDPTVPANLTDLINIVVHEKADLGIAFDGDGDRVNLVTNSGQCLDADALLMCFVNDILPGCPGETVVYDVKSSYHLPRLISQLGGKPLMCKSGHSFVKKAMLDAGAILGGEYSAHLFFKHRWYGFDDGMYAAARFLELMDKQACSADDILKKVPRSLSTPELGIEVADNRKQAVMADLLRLFSLPDAQINTLDGIRADFSDGWGLVRVSNTTPKLVLRFEADSPESLNRIQRLFRSQLTRVLPETSLPF